MYSERYLIRISVPISVDIGITSAAMSNCDIIQWSFGKKSHVRETGKTITFDWNP